MKNNDFTYNHFIEVLHAVGGVTPMQLRMIRFLDDDLKINMTDASKMFILFLLIRESLGSTLISLKEGVAEELFFEYFNAQKSLYQERIDSLFKEYDLDEQDVEKYIRKAFAKAIKEIKENKYSEIISDDKDASVPFIIQNDRLFIQKYFYAKTCIEERVKVLFKKQEASASSIEKIQKESIEINGYALKEKQAEAVAKGSQGSLIVTGGPGTGKTTVVFSILRALLKRGGVEQILLAAPSGKAADRMNESLDKAKKNAKDEGLDWSIMQRAQTIHRLLKYNPGVQEFGYNEENQLPENSVIVIDEASMVDINLFAALLKAVPSSAKLFLLGDENQLPSVDAGAVLGNLLAQKEDIMVRLNESNRFAGDLLKVVEEILEAKHAGLPKEFTFKKLEEKTNLQSCLNDVPGKKGYVEKELSKVTFFDIPQGKRSELSDAQKNLLKAWYTKFYAKATNNFAGYFAEEAEHEFTDEVLDVIFKEQLESARILCAEHKSRMGIDEINDYLIKKIHPSKREHLFFAGEMLMLTRNMDNFGIFNGDIGIVIAEKNERGEESLQLVFCKNKEYKRFVLSDFDYEALVPAYAMTIHKSQGSEFGHVLIFLPETENHPLMSNEIIYTGISRAKYSCVVISNQVSFEKGLIVTEKRDTGIDLSND